MAKKTHAISFMIGALVGGYGHGRYLKTTHAKDMEEYYKEVNILKGEFEYIRNHLINKHKLEASASSSPSVLGEVDSTGDQQV